MAGPRKYCEVFYDGVRVPLSNVVGGLHNGWSTAMSTLSFERGTAALALLIGLNFKVEQLLAACPSDRRELRSRLARLRAEGASIRAMTYRFALDSEHSVPDASGSLIRLSFAEFASRPLRSTFTVSTRLKSSACMAGVMITSTDFRKPLRVARPRFNAISLASGCSAFPRGPVSASARSSHSSRRP
jgi:hypothetical protein